METTYAVSGMTCGNCVHHVTEEVSAIPGVDSVDVTLENGGRMTITSAAAVDDGTVKAAVAEAGDYTATAL